MELLPEDAVERVLEWYEKDPGEALVGEEVLALDLEALRTLFRPDDEDPLMHLTYEVAPEDVPRLQPHVAHPIDLGAHDYFVAAYRKEA